MWSTMAKLPCRFKEEIAGAEEGCITESSPKQKGITQLVYNRIRNFGAILEFCITDSTP